MKDVIRNFCYKNPELMFDVVFLAASITWTAPPPKFDQTDVSDIRTVDVPVLNGSTQAALRWSYTLPDGIGLRTTNFRKGASPDASLSDVGSIFHDLGTYQLRDARFNISRSEVATLIINKVTEREQAVYQCEVETNDGMVKRWKYNIRVIVTGGYCHVHTYMIVSLYSSHNQIHVNCCPPYPPTPLPFTLQTKGILTCKL